MSACLIALGVAGALGGVLAAGAALPAVGVVHLVTGDVAQTVLDLPPTPADDLLPQRTVLLDRDGRRFAQFYTRNRASVPLSAIAPIMRTAIVAVEDTRFYEHAGLDLKGTLRALITNARAGAIRQGGSSLTQQLAKNMLVESAATEAERDRARAPNLDRKIEELRYALALEKKYTKDEILERYLNITYFGAGAYGVEAAAQRFFSTSAARLTLPQAATLVGAVRAPYTTDPSLGDEHRRRLLERRDIVLDRMAEVGAITAEQARAAKAAPLGLRLRGEPAGCTESSAPFFCLYVRGELLNNPAFGRTRAEREERLARGGLIIRTSLDPVAQRAAERAIAERVSPRDTAVAAQAMVEPGTGWIRAMAASKRHGNGRGDRGTGPYTTYNLAADMAHGGGQGFQAGSTFKVFTLATALAQGWRFGQGLMTPGSFVPDEGFRDCAGRPVDDPGAVVHNVGGEGWGGPQSISTGTWNSVNVFYMMLEQRVGLCEVVRTAQALGIARADGTPLREVPTFTLGANEMDPVTVAGAYAAFGARGRYCRPAAIVEIIDRAGRSTAHPPACAQAIDPGVADAVNHVLSGVFTRGTMRGYGIGRPAAGKTGTNDGHTSAWFAGYTPDLAAAVSVGDIRGAFRHPLRDVTIGGRYYGAVQGASLPGPIWVASMTGALRGVPATPFTAPDMNRFGGGYTPGMREAELARSRAEAERARRAEAERARRAERRAAHRAEREFERAARMAGHPWDLAPDEFLVPGPDRPAMPGRGWAPPGGREPGRRAERYAPWSRPH